MLKCYAKRTNPLKGGKTWHGLVSCTDENDSQKVVWSERVGIERLTQADAMYDAKVRAGMLAEINGLSADDIVEMKPA